GRCIDVLRVDASKFAIRPGIAEIPHKLHARNLDLQRSRLRPAKMNLAPRMRGHHAETNEDHKSRRGPHDFQQVIAANKARLLPVVAISEDHPSQCELREHENNSCQNERDEELLINLTTDGSYRSGKPPCLCNVEIDGRTDQNEDNDCQQDGRY